VAAIEVGSVSSPSRSDNGGECVLAVEDDGTPVTMGQLGRTKADVVERGSWSSVVGGGGGGGGGGGRLL
jgi:hypothetical protein